MQNLHAVIPYVWTNYQCMSERRLVYGAVVRPQDCCYRLNGGSGPCPAAAWRYRKLDLRDCLARVSSVSPRGYSHRSMCSYIHTVTNVLVTGSLSYRASPLIMSAWEQAAAFCSQKSPDSDDEDDDEAPDNFIQRIHLKLYRNIRQVSCYSNNSGWWVTETRLLQTARGFSLHTIPRRGGGGVCSIYLHICQFIYFCSGSRPPIILNFNIRPMALQGNNGIRTHQFNIRIPNHFNGQFTRHAEFPFPCGGQPHRVKTDAAIPKCAIIIVVLFCYLARRKQMP